MADLPDFLKSYESQAKQMILNYYNGEMPFEIFFREADAINWVCARIYLKETGDMNEEQMHQSISEVLDNLFEFNAEMIRWGEFLERTTVIKGGKHPDNID